MHILLTRPIEDSKELIIKLNNLGHKVSHLPVINVVGEEYRDFSEEEFKGIIFTSSNAVKNLNLKKINKNIQCFCVGSATERTARINGFQKVYSADGNVSNLKEIIIQVFHFELEWIKFNHKREMRKKDKIKNDSLTRIKELKKRIKNFANE